MVAPASQEFDLRSAGVKKTQAGQRQFAYVVGVIIAAFVVAPFAFYLSDFRSDPFSPGALFVYGACLFMAGASADFLFTGFRPGPDRIVLDPTALRLYRQGRLMRSLLWTDPNFTLELIDVSEDSRVRVWARVWPYSMKLSRSTGNFWDLTPECLEAIAAAARAHGLVVVENDAGVYHFPEGRLLTIGKQPKLPSRWAIVPTNKRSRSARSSIGRAGR